MFVTAVYYDGKQARQYEVVLSVDGDVLQIQGDAILRQEGLSVLKIQPKLGNTARLIMFSDGARCEISDHAGFDALLPQPGRSWAVALESSWRYALPVLLLTVSMAIAAYRWGLPYVAEQVADKIPGSVLVELDRQFFANLDDKLLKPSQLAVERQQQIRKHLQQLSLPSIAIKPLAIEFRNVESMGPNAFSLPGGTVLVLDKLVEIAANDEEVLAVLAHELGHVSERHALRQMLQASVVGLVMAWYVGDVSSLLAAAPTLLLQTGYTRELERRADSFAAELLKINGLSVNLLADMLVKLEAAQKTDALKKDGNSSIALDYLSTHPNTDERIRELRGM